jgi:hypothetical protein
MTSFDLSSAVIRDDDRVLRIASLVKGEVVHADPIPLEELENARRTAQAVPGHLGPSATFRLGNAQILVERVFEPGSLRFTGDVRYLVLCRPDPQHLIERDAASLSRSLHSLSFGAILEYASELRQVLASNQPTLLQIARQIDGGSMTPSGLNEVFIGILPEMLRPGALAEAVDSELGSGTSPGRQYLDGWVEGAGSHPGMMACLARNCWGRDPSATLRFAPRVRAIPTRQLHITAGNSPVVAFLSHLRARLTKGAATIKAASGAIGMQAILAAALRAAGPGHPFTRHISLVYWPGGDRDVEDVLLASGAYDRVIVWGSEETVRSVRSRAVHTKVITLAPRYGVSLIGSASCDSFEDAAAAGSLDSLIWDQKACTASLVHYVEGDEASAVAYCRSLQKALARWDALLPRPLPKAVQGQIRLLKRGPLAKGIWFENGQVPDLRSVVVLAREPFDLSLHPMSRFVVVRPVSRLEDALRWIGPAVSTAGVFPPLALHGLRDVLGAAGVSNVFPLGECERVWPGMPHDGMKILSELVSWVSSGDSGVREA